MKITCGKDYENAGSNSIENLDDVRRFLHSNMLECLKARTFGFNKDWFQDIWGKQDFCWVGGSESKRFYIWVHEKKHCTIIVLTNCSKGTCYEYVIKGERSKAQEEIIEFIEYVIKNNPNRRDSDI